MPCGFPRRGSSQRAWAALVGRGGGWVTRHAIFAGFAATALLAALAIPALAVDTGQPTVKELPKASQARIAFEEVSHVMGPGWPTPYNIVVVANKGAVTTPAMLASLAKLQTQIAHDPSVKLPVNGPGQINATSLQLKKFGPSLAHSAQISKQSKKDLLKLINGLGQAGAGSEQLRAGLERGRHRRREAQQRRRGGARRLDRAAQRAHPGEHRLDADRERA